MDPPTLLNAGKTGAAEGCPNGGSPGASDRTNKSVGPATICDLSAHDPLLDILEFLPDAAFVIDHDKKVIVWNKACERLTGVSREAILGLGISACSEALFGERRPILVDLLDETSPEAEGFYKDIKRTGATISAESFISRLPSGRSGHFWGAAAPLYDREGRRCGAIELIRDITDQKRTDQSLQESELKYRELVEHAHSIILRWDSDGRITFLNEYGQKFFGYAAHEVLGRRVTDMIVPSVETGGRDLHEFIRQLCAHPAAFEHSVNENIRRNGERVWITWANRVAKDDKGRVVEILSVGTDITERKRAENAIQELNATLERRVVARTEELAIARDRAEAADRVKSAFLANMSHELRTPLNSVIGFTGILLQGLAGPLNNEQDKQLRMVQASARHLLALINDVLDISKIEANQIEIGRARFDLRESVHRVIHSVTPLAEKKSLRLVSEVASELPQLTSDKRRVEQVLLNLLSNAIKFTDKGSITLSADEWDPARRLVRVRVADTGMGIRAEEIPNLFQPFRQIDSGLTRQHEGTGLGLAISKRLVERLGGEIRVESHWGEGSTFTVILPVEPPGKP